MPDKIHKNAIPSECRGYNAEILQSTGSHSFKLMRIACYASTAEPL